MQINHADTHPKEGVNAVQGCMNANAHCIEKEECYVMSLFMSNIACNSSFHMSFRIEILSESQIVFFLY